MYSNCIFCPADLGRNDALEAFPVGRSVAFDAWKGRLWAICPSCLRWNLAPLEERWEAVEAADRLFTDARLRVSSENIGLARLRDGTRLVRVGEALPRELAAWRYGDQLRSRRNRYLLGVGAAVAVGGAATWAGVAAAGIGLGALWQAYAYVGQPLVKRWSRSRPVTVLTPEAHGVVAPVTLRRWHLARAHLALPQEGEGVSLVVPDGFLSGPDDSTPARPLVVRPESAPAVLGRAMVHVNRRGATKSTLDGAVKILAGAGTADSYLRWAAKYRNALGDEGASPLSSEGALALEMALHEESERRALQGELSALEAAWREAEEIAAIADRLPDELNSPPAPPAAG